MTRARPDDVLIYAAATGHNPDEIAEMSGFTPATIRQRLDRPDYQLRIRQRRTQIIQELMGNLIEAAQGAAAFLTDVIDDDEQSASARVRAATALLAEARSWRETAVEQRLADIEEMLLNTEPGRVTIQASSTL